VDDLLQYKIQTADISTGRISPLGSRQMTGLSTQSKRALLRQRSVQRPGGASLLAYLPETRKRPSRSCSI
jgi:hypothetical protein